MHLESNAFAPVTTGADFRASCYLAGDEILAEAGEPTPAIPGEISGFVAEMNRDGAWEPVPMLVTATEIIGLAPRYGCTFSLRRLRCAIRGVRLVVVEAT